MMPDFTPRSILPAGRSRLLVAVLLLGLLGLAGRAAYLQGMHNGFLQQKGESRYSRVIEMSAHRGMIRIGMVSRSQSVHRWNRCGRARRTWMQHPRK